MVPCNLGCSKYLLSVCCAIYLISVWNSLNNNVDAPKHKVVHFLRPRLSYQPLKAAVQVCTQCANNDALSWLSIIQTPTSFSLVPSQPSPLTLLSTLSTPSKPASNLQTTSAFTPMHPPTPPTVPSSGACIKGLGALSWPRSPHVCLPGNSLYHPLPTSAPSVAQTSLMDLSRSILHHLRNHQIDSAQTFYPPRWHRYSSNAPYSFPRLLYRRIGLLFHSHSR